MVRSCPNFIAGERRPSRATQQLPVTNPATGEVLTDLPLSAGDEIDDAVASAREAFRTWSETPVMERARVLFRFKQKLEEHRNELVELVVLDNGKTLAEAQGEVQRGIEVVEFATGIPAHILGTVAEDVARGIDCEMLRQPLGVVAGFTPFNFPVMVPLWMIPVAVACGNTFVLKPSERSPLPAVRLAELFAECGAPPGTLNVVHGASRDGRAAAGAPRRGGGLSRRVQPGRQARLCDGGRQRQTGAGARRGEERPGRHARCRPQCHGRIDRRRPPSAVRVNGAWPARICLRWATLPSGWPSRSAAAASRLKLGPGIDPSTKMGPVITAQAKDRVHSYVDAGVHSRSPPAPRRSPRRRSRPAPADTSSAPRSSTTSPRRWPSLATRFSARS